MLFNSLEFVAFLVLVVVAYHLLGHRLQNRLLLAASYWFYGSWDWRFLGLIALSTVVDYTVARRLDRTEAPRVRKRWVTLSVATNLGILGAFKYFDFFAESFAALLGTLGVEAGWTTLNVVLPVGISFYTFQTMGYTIDVYRRELRAQHDFLDFALYVAFFPQLVAGPIERARRFAPQIASPRTPSLDAFTRGCFLILFGLMKKTAIADGLAGVIDPVFAQPASFTRVDVLLATYCFALQIYCDFSGYTDVARGVAKLLGFDLTHNFELPYFARNPQDFWRRWHISLSTWLRDYLYIPLGGNRVSALRTRMNLMITMTLGGLWHGAAWNFVLWGAFHGAILVVHRVGFGTWRGDTGGRWSSALRIVLFFQVVCFGWLIFRADSWGAITALVGQLVAGSGAAQLGLASLKVSALAGIPLLLAMDAAQYVSGSTTWYRRLSEPLRGALYAAIFVVLLMGTGNLPAEFIYFQF
jgi:D-alanyl-lipoteichoic acid acyltransferase DltB (MBOAT superfamily)